MKMRRRAALLLAVISVFAAMGICGCGKEEKNVISVTSGEVKEGEEITVYIQATDEIPVTAYGMEIDYNPDELTCKECEKTEEYEKAWAGMDISNDTETDDGQTIMIAGVNANEEQGKYKGNLYAITFTATGKKGTKANLTLRISALEDIEQKSYLDEYTIKNGTIKIK